MTCALNTREKTHITTTIVIRNFPLSLHPNYIKKVCTNPRKLSCVLVLFYNREIEGLINFFFLSCHMPCTIFSFHFFRNISSLKFEQCLSGSEEWVYSQQPSSFNVIHNPLKYLPNFFNQIHCDLVDTIIIRPFFFATTNQTFLLMHTNSFSL